MDDPPRSRSEFREMFIKSVRSRTFLYDIRAENYKDKDLKDNAWAEIAAEFGIDDALTAKAEWKKIRDNFRDALKRKAAISGRASVAQLTPYKYHEQMSFLIPFITNRRQARNGGPPYMLLSETETQDAASNQDADTAGDSEEAEAGSGELGQAKRQRRSQIQRMSGDADGSSHHRKASASWQPGSHPLDNFFKAMCETTKLMPKQLQLQVKRSIFEVVADAEEHVMGGSSAEMDDGPA